MAKTVRADAAVTANASAQPGGNRHRSAGYSGGGGKADALRDDARGGASGTATAASSGHGQVAGGRTPSHSPEVMHEQQCLNTVLSVIEDLGTGLIHPEDEMYGVPTQRQSVAPTADDLQPEVNELTRRLQRLPALGVDELNPEDDANEVDELTPEAMLSVVNPGSLGHPELCPRPCLYYASGKCTNGDACEFCHMPHLKRPAHLDKRHREMLKEMPFSECVQILLPIMKQKAQALSLGPEVVELIDSLGSAAGGAQSQASSTKRSRDLRSLLTALRSMSLRSLLTTLHRTSLPLACPERASIDEVLQCLRVQSSR
eukprot:gnl/TRDRNA2_/TRDRNA2_71957_c0_seq1.p1 gnl/TRDRNA2_/TRDRNA2_71957_c0~~gnl/TRDRNA2_/TRDRNA2_71957_c0_seq1.p1  ORF type:complete len:316 (+),score=46.42 gnl/TRDRNA2_/TRDRNA2_71957_c0_seq1:67-1014(+)